MLKNIKTKEFLNGKIHRATITGTFPDYEGSITIDKYLMDLSDIAEYEKVLVANIDTGERFETYAIYAEPYSGRIEINGAAAKKAKIGEKVIIMSFVSLEKGDNGKYENSPFMVKVDDKNKVIIFKD
jgi:aspartate 1-decarboxylase